MPRDPGRVLPTCAYGTWYRLWNQQEPVKQPQPHPLSAIVGENLESTDLGRQPQIREPFLKSRLPGQRFSLLSEQNQNKTKQNEFGCTGEGKRNFARSAPPQDRTAEGQTSWQWTLLWGKRDRWENAQLLSCAEQCWRNPFLSCCAQNIEADLHNSGVEGNQEKGRKEILQSSKRTLLLLNAFRTPAVSLPTSCWANLTWGFAPPGLQTPPVHHM